MGTRRSEDCSVHGTALSKDSRSTEPVAAPKEEFVMTQDLPPGSPGQLDSSEGVKSESWIDEVERLYREVEAEINPHQDLCLLRGVCCDFRNCDHRLYASSIEVAYARDRLERRNAEISSSDPDLCPFWRDGRCEARAERPLGCRTYFCDPSWIGRGEEIYERYYARLRALSSQHGLEHSYAPWVTAIREAGELDPQSPST